MACFFGAAQVGCLCVMLDPLFFCPEYFVFLADVMAATLPLSEGWGSDTAMEADWPSFSASDSNGSDGGKYRSEELGCSSSSPTAALIGFGMTGRMAVVRSSTMDRSQ